MFSYLHILDRNKYRVEYIVWDALSCECDVAGQALTLIVQVVSEMNVSHRTC